MNKIERLRDAFLKKEKHLGELLEQLRVILNETYGDVFDNSLKMEKYNNFYIKGDIQSIESDIKIIDNTINDIDSFHKMVNEYKDESIENIIDYNIHFFARGILKLSNNTEEEIQEFVRKWKEENE